jgi:hypothetical protein
MEKWEIKIKTLKCGPGGTVHPGEIYMEYANIAAQLIASGQAILISKPEEKKPEIPPVKPEEVEERIIKPKEVAITRPVNKRGRPKTKK